LVGVSEPGIGVRRLRRAVFVFVGEGVMFAREHVMVKAQADVSGRSLVARSRNFFRVSDIDKLPILTVRRNEMLGLFPQD
jgi:hypothetical protein